ncbi:hypothetical protein BRADI_1g02306v3 [Brachypodium distachyon]|uniref:Uncharacterized protein n=1 Tax=Brachypodium distachyon TaxID=15368 RepID=A0A0Q3JJ13_BRADI|nr:hypothetical protein BRADI_1g02306v3 [Brachypodium distachyon]
MVRFPLVRPRPAARSLRLNLLSRLLRIGDPSVHTFWFHGYNLHTVLLEWLSIWFGFTWIVQLNRITG